jgi:hypothetical protein
MNDFKVGDMVEVIDTAGCSGYYDKLGEVGVVTSIQCGDFAKYDLVETSLAEGRQMHRNRFKKVEAVKDLRKELSDAIDLLTKYKVKSSPNFPDTYYLGHGNKSLTKENLLNWIFPPVKTPKELEVERIESEMRKLADELAKVNQEN